MYLLLVPVAFIPMILVCIWIRNSELYERESWTPLVYCFIWGSLIATSAAFLLEQTLSLHVHSFLLLSVFFAPLIEESIKPLILKFLSKEINELEDGFIFGAIIGLGFAATENLIYGIRFWNEGLLVLISLFYIRSIGTSFLHASTTSITGYGYSKTKHAQRSFLNIFPYFALAVGLHSLFNLFVFSAYINYQILGVVIAVVIAFSMLIWIREKIQFFDKRQLLVQTDDPN